MDNFLLSPIDCIMECDHKQSLIKAYVPYCFETLPIQVILYPTCSCRDYLPMAIRFDNCNHCDRYEYNDFCIFFVNYITIQTDILHFNTRLGNQNISISCGNTSSVCIEQNNELVFLHTFPFKTSSPTIKRIGNCQVITFNTESSKYLLVIKDNEKIYSAKASELVVDNNTISCIKKFDDMLQQARLVSIDCNNGEVQSELIYLDEPKLTFLPELIPCAFFEALRTDNCTLARQFLTDTLSTRLDDEHLLTFFGDFDKVIPLQINNQPTIFLMNTLDKKSKAFVVQLDKDKISNVKLI